MQNQDYMNRMNQIYRDQAREIWGERGGRMNFGGAITAKTRAGYKKYKKILEDLIETHPDHDYRELQGLASDQYQEEKMLGKPITRKKTTTKKTTTKKATSTRAINCYNKFMHLNTGLTPAQRKTGYKKYLSTGKCTPKKSIYSVKGTKKAPAKKKRAINCFTEFRRKYPAKIYHIPPGEVSGRYGQYLRHGLCIPKNPSAAYKNDVLMGMNRLEYDQAAQVIDFDDPFYAIKKKR